MRALIIKTSSLGDILHTIPTIQFIADLYPEGKIDWVVEEECSSIVKALSFVDRTLCFNSKKWKRARDFQSFKVFIQGLRKVEYDVIFDFQGNCKSAVVLAFSKGLKVGFDRKSVSEWPNLFFTHFKFDPPKGKNIRQDYLYLAESFFEKEADKTYGEVILSLSQEERQELDILKALLKPRSILVCPGSVWKNKQLSLQTLEKVLHRYKQNQLVFSWGTEEEQIFCASIAKGFSESLILPEKVSIPQLQHLMTQVDLVIAMDSLPLHLCALTKTPTLSFFGPSLAEKYAPLGNQHNFHQGKCPYSMVFAKRCPHLRTCKTGACLKKISLDS